MINYIVAFPKIEDAKNLKNILAKMGCSNIFVCNSGAQAITYANELDGGIILSGYRLSDMHYNELFNYLPREFLMLLLASPNKISEGYQSGVEYLEMPFKMGELRVRLTELTEEYYRRFPVKKKTNTVQNRRSEKEKKKIDEAKTYLMESKNMTEQEAHKHLQKLSMDSGNNLVETAEMILTFK